MVPPQNMSTLSLIPEERRRMLPTTSKSTESLYSSSSSKYSVSALQKRRAINRHAGFIPATSEVRQRVLSARLLRMKTLQNQLADAQQHISELLSENRILRTLHKRQDNALSKYESTNAELPQLLHSHAEEIRIWQAKYRNLHSQNRELANKLKHKEDALLVLSDKNRHLTQLSLDKNLEERERLTDRVRYLEYEIAKKENDVKLMARKLDLEFKNHKTQIQVEHQRYKEVVSKLDKVQMELDTIVNSRFNPNDHRSRLSMAPRSMGLRSSKNIPEHHRGPCHTHLHLQPNYGESRISKSPIMNDQSVSPMTGEEVKKTPTKSKKGSSAKGNETQRLIVNGNGNEGESDDLVSVVEKGMSQAGDYYDEEDDYSENCNEDDSNKTTHTNGKNQYLNGEDQTDRSQYHQINTTSSAYDDEDYNDADDIVSGDMADQSNTPRSASVVDEFNAVRKQMTRDYLQKDSFIDNFCRLSVNDVETTLSISSRSAEPSGSADTSRRQNIDQKKKVELLEALKAIDADKRMTEN